MDWNGFSGEFYRAQDLRLRLHADHQRTSALNLSRPVSLESEIFELREHGDEDDDGPPRARATLAQIFGGDEDEADAVEDQ